eukprot:scaffold320062_cov28-Tisochrysis_lutea.AAC.2
MLQSATALVLAGRGFDLEVRSDFDAILAVFIDFGHFDIYKIASFKKDVVDALNVFLRELRDVAEAIDARTELDKHSEGDHALDLAARHEITHLNRRRRRRRWRARSKPPRLSTFRDHGVYLLSGGQDGLVAGGGNRNHRRVTLIDVDV